MNKPKRDRYNTIKRGDILAKRKCACGCGCEVLLLYEDFEPARVKKKGSLKRFLCGHQFKTDKHKTLVSKIRKGTGKIIPNISPSTGRRIRKIRGNNVNYAREVMEKHLSRELASNECVHHIDRDATNDNISNLQLMTRQEHSLLHHPKEPDKFIELVCENCGKKFIRLKSNAISKHHYCSKYCFYKSPINHKQKGDYNHE